MLKNGDEVICIKEFTSKLENLGRKFIIQRVDHRSCFIHIGLFFFEKGPTWQFNNHFILLKEQRKLKLENIQKNK